MSVRSLSSRILMPAILTALAVSLLAPVVAAMGDPVDEVSDTILLKDEKNGDQNGDNENGCSQNGKDASLCELGAMGMAPRGRGAGAPAPYSSNLFVSAPQALPGQVVYISGCVCNNGSGSGSHTAVFYINGRAEQSQNVSVRPGGCSTVAFYFARAVPGQYQVAVDGSIGYVNVVSPRWVTGTTPATEDSLGTAGILCLVVVLVALVVAIIYIERTRKA